MLKTCCRLNITLVDMMLKYTVSGNKTDGLAGMIGFTIIYTDYYLLYLSEIYLHRLTFTEAVCLLSLFHLPVY